MRMPSRVRKFLRLLWIAPIFLACFIGPSSADDRVVFLLLSKPSKSATKGMDDWVKCLKLALDTFVQNSAASGQTIPVQIEVRSKTVSSVPSRSLLKAYWNSAQSLQAVGAVAMQDQSTTVIFSDIYLGSLKGALPHPYLLDKQRIEPKSYKFARDTVTIVTLYATAMDVGRNSSSRADQQLVCTLLQRANLYRDVKKIRNRLASLFKAIRHSLEYRKCGAT